jgi:hypothetical protein
MTNQQFADTALAQWQELRALPADERIEVLFNQFFAPPPPSDLEYQILLNRVHEEMAA